MVQLIFAVVPYFVKIFHLYFRVAPFLYHRNVPFLYHRTAPYDISMTPLF